MPSSILSNLKRQVNPQFFLSLFLYLVFLVTYYFKGLKGDSSNFTVFLSIILYVFNIFWFYTKRSKIFDNPIPTVIQLMLFYLLNLILSYSYFDPFNKSTNQSTSGEKMVIDDYKPLIFSGMAIIGFVGMIMFSFFIFGLKTSRVPGGLGVPKSILLGHSIFENYLSNLLKFGGFFMAIIGICSLLMFFLLYTPLSITFISTILNIGILFVTLALFYKSLKKPKGLFDNLPPWANLLLSYIFYIPCLIISLVDSTKSQYSSTKKTYTTILAVEILLICLRILLPYLYKLYNKYFTIQGDVIEKGPIYLDNKHSLGVIKNYEEISKIMGQKIKDKSYNYNYAVSANIWINPQSKATSPAYNKPTTILDYGEVFKINLNKNNLEFLASTTEDDKITEPLVKIYQTKDFFYQKWNSIVLNYEGGTLDVFINNTLVSSTPNITPIMKYNSVITGSDNGIQGGIKNIIYYNRVLTRNDVKAIYNK